MGNGDAIRKYGADYINGCAESSKCTDKNFGNGDGKLQANELAADMTGIFSDDVRFTERSETLRKQFEELSKTYVGADGAISAGKKAELINSKEWDALLKQYHALYNEMEYFKDVPLNDAKVNKTATQNYALCKEAMQNTDKSFGNNDGKVTVDEYYKQINGIYNDCFKDNPFKLFLASQVAKMQAEIMKKYAGPDGILEPGEYDNGLHSQEYGVTLDIYWALRGGRPD